VLHETRHIFYAFLECSSERIHLLILIPIEPAEDHCELRDYSLSKHLLVDGCSDELLLLVSQQYLGLIELNSQTLVLL
jgi:hypothetical protein